MNEKELLEELIKSVNRMQEDISEIKDRTLKIEEKTSKIEDRTLKIEITLENETNKNIQLLMEAQSLNAEKMKNVDMVLDDIESSVVATEAKYSLQGTTQGNGLTGGLPPVRFSM